MNDAYGSREVPYLAMTLPAILFTAISVAAVGMIYLFSRKPKKFVDLGAVSASWVAEHRAGPNE